MSETQSRPVSSSEAWGLQYPGLVLGAEGGNQVREFTGMWKLRPDADLNEFTAKLTEPWFLPTTAKLALIRTARWFVARTQDYDGYTLFFDTQFDGPLQKYFDDFVLNGRDNLLKIWGQCVGCPTGPDSTARDIVEFIAQGQIRTLTVYDGFPEISYSQVNRMADWYKKTQAFQRAVGKPGGSLEDKVSEFMGSLSQPAEVQPNDAAVDQQLDSGWQYENVAQRTIGQA